MLPLWGHGTFQEGVPKVGVALLILLLHSYFFETMYIGDKGLAQVSRVAPLEFKAVKRNRKDRYRAQSLSPSPRKGDKQGCFHCGAMGHFKRECPSLENSYHRLSPSSLTRPSGLLESGGSCSTSLLSSSPSTLHWRTHTPDSHFHL
jgi:hypothetical protein